MYGYLIGFTLFGQTHAVESIMTIIKYNDCEIKECLNNSSSWMSIIKTCIEI